MKKVLLGLLALSAVVMAKTPNPTDESTINVDTRALIVTSGLIISDTSDGDAIEKIDLDHGTLIGGGKDSPASTATNQVYIRKAGDKKTTIPEGAIFKVKLNDNNNNHQLTSSVVNSSPIAHTLSATVSTDKVTPVTGNSSRLEISAEKPTPAEGSFTVKDGGADHVQVTLNSNIAVGAYDSAAEGTYTNTSTLSVQYSQNPGAPSGNN